MCAYCDKKFSQKNYVVYHIKHSCKKVKELEEQVLEDKDQLKKQDLKKKLMQFDDKVDFAKLIVSSQNIKNKDKILDEFKLDINGLVSTEASQKILGANSRLKSL